MGGAVKKGLVLVVCLMAAGMSANAAEPSSACGGSDPVAVQPLSDGGRVCIKGYASITARGDTSGKGYVVADGDSAIPADGYVGAENGNEDTGHQPAVVGCRSGDYKNDSDATVEPSQGNHVIVGADQTVTAADAKCLTE